jgi:hypothetical protein
MKWTTVAVILIAASLAAPRVAAQSNPVGASEQTEVRALARVPSDAATAFDTATRGDRFSPDMLAAVALFRIPDFAGDEELVVSWEHWPRKGVRNVLVEEPATAAQIRDGALFTLTNGGKALGPGLYKVMLTASAGRSEHKKDNVKVTTSGTMYRALVFTVGKTEVAAATDAVVDRSDLRAQTFGSIAFAVPQKCLVSDWSGFSGRLILDPDKANGMFLVTIPAKTEAAAIEAEIRSSVTYSLASRSGGTDFVWNETEIAPLEQTPARTGMRYEGTGERKLLQVVVFRGDVGARKIAFGYFAMRDAKGPGRTDDGTFLDASGNGVPDFDAFARSIKAAR